MNLMAYIPEGIVVPLMRTDNRTDYWCKLFRFQNKEKKAFYVRFNCFIAAAFVRIHKI